MHLVQYEYEYHKFKILKHSLIETIQEKYGHNNFYSFSFALPRPKLSNQSWATIKRAKISEFEPEYQTENSKSPLLSNNSNMTSIEIEIPISWSTKVEDWSIAAKPIESKESWTTEYAWKTDNKTTAAQNKNNEFSTHNSQWNFSLKKLHQKDRKIAKDIIIPNYVTKVTTILNRDQRDSFVIEKDHFTRLLILDKFIAKSIIDGYISLLYKLYSREDCKFLIFYEGSVVDKIKKKLINQINQHRRYSIPDDIKHHFILFRDTEKEQSQYGIIKIDFSQKKIIYDGPIHDNPSPIQSQTGDETDKENVYSYSICNPSELNPRSSQKNPFIQNKCESELIRQIVFDHILEYKSSSEISLIEDIQKCFEYQNLQNSNSECKFKDQNLFAKDEKKSFTLNADNLPKENTN